MKTNATCSLASPLACQGKWASAGGIGLHRLAGAADIIGAHTLAQQCRVLENACKTVTLSR